MKKQYVIVGLYEVPILDQYGDERNYILGAHIGTTLDINEAEKIASDNSKRFEHGVEIKTVFINYD